MRIILASESPFRMRALELLGLTYETKPTHIDERAIRSDRPEELVLKLAEAKARAMGGLEPDALIIAADLVDVCGGKIYEKPADLDEAKRMLGELSGQWVEIVAGLAVYRPEGEKLLTAVTTCRIKFRKLTEFEIDDYIARYEVLRFAGAFDADGILRFSEEIQGSYNFYAGLPVNELVLLLREQGVKV